MTKPVVVAITGASGAIYAQRLIEQLLAHDRNIFLLISPSGAEVIRQELNITLDLSQFQCDAFLPDCEGLDRITYFHHADFLSAPASGSAKTKAMVICPCSGGTLSGVVCGASRNLIQRAAEVHLKERRKLILVTRETPLSLVHIRNMEAAHLAGATILPASPGWYHGVNCLNDIADFVVARILDQLEIENSVIKRWGDE
jgi:flavin prenyltransferase